MTKSTTRQGIRAIALVEATKGVLVLLAGFGLLSLVHHDVQRLADHLVDWLHMNPRRAYSRIFLKAASEVNDSRLMTLAALALLYSLMRLTEAYGLWRERRWAEWFALLSGGIYLPIEVYELARGITWIRLLAFVINLAIVAYMGYALCRPRSHGEIEGAKLDVPIAD
jgi:uncharacterized membrane protein (DUF2068 family)